MRDKGGIPELIELLRGVRIEIYTSAPYTIIFDSLLASVDSIIKDWAAWHNIKLEEDPEYCEPDSVKYADGIDFAHFTGYYCAAILENGDHIHIKYRSGYVGDKNYFYVDDVFIFVPAPEG